MSDTVVIYLERTICLTRSQRKSMAVRPTSRSLVLPGLRACRTRSASRSLAGALISLFSACRLT